MFVRCIEDVTEEDYIRYFGKLNVKYSNQNPVSCAHKKVMMYFKGRISDVLYNTINFPYCMARRRIERIKRDKNFIFEVVDGNDVIALFVAPVTENDNIHVPEILIDKSIEDFEILNKIYETVFTFLSKSCSFKTVSAEFYDNENAYINFLLSKGFDFVENKDPFDYLMLCSAPMEKLREQNQR